MAETGGDLAEFVRRHDPDRFLCALFAPAARRGALLTLIAFNHELARAREAAANPIAALIRLQWWREAVAEAAEGRTPRRHEVAAPLHDAIAGGLLDPADLTALVDAREAEAEEDGLPTRAAFDAYLRGTAGGMAVVAGRLLGAPGEASAVLQGLGAGFGLAGMLRSVAVHAAQGRCLLPRDVLAEAELGAEEVIADPARATPVIRRLAADGSGPLAAARGAARGIPREAVAAALPAILAARDLRRLAAGGTVPAPRGFGDRAAVALAGIRGAV